MNLEVLIYSALIFMAVLVFFGAIGAVLVVAVKRRKSSAPMSPAMAPGQYGVALIHAYEAAGTQRAGLLIEDMLGHYRKNQIVGGMAEAFSASRAAAPPPEIVVPVAATPATAKKKAE